MVVCDCFLDTGNDVTLIPVSFAQIRESMQVHTAACKPFDLEQLPHMAGHVTNLATKFECPMTTRS